MFSVCRRNSTLKVVRALLFFRSLQPLNAFAFVIRKSNDGSVLRHRIVESCKIGSTCFLSNQAFGRSLSALSAASSRESWEAPDEASSDEEAPDDDVENDEETPFPSSPLFPEFERWLNALENTQTALEKKQRSLQNELDKAEKIQKLQARANLLTTYLYLFTDGVTTATVQDWEQEGAPEVELSLNPAYESASDEANSIYEQARKLKRGSQVVRPLLEETSKALEMLSDLKVDLESSVSENGDLNEEMFRLAQDRLIRSSRTTQFSPPKASDDNHNEADNNKSKRQRMKKPELGTPTSNVRKLKSKCGNVIYVGRNRRGNEYLSFNVAKGNDIWMHARGAPGAHVVIKCGRGKDSITDDCIQLAANLAAFYSDARSERKAAVTACEPKHILKPRGAPLGAVKLREELFVRTAFPDDVPDELKEARELSGQALEYRATDKAKLRKRNKEAAKQQKAKRRAKAKAEKQKN